jgi:hypothetical protein
MERTVEVVRTGAVIAAYPIIVQGLNYTPSDEEYFQLAQQNALEDGVVDQAHAHELEFRFAT